MSKDLKRINNFDEIVFEIRNKEYGAFVLRKKYSRNVIISLLIGIIIMATAIITPYFNAKTLKNRPKHVERQVEIMMQNLDQPNEIVVPPPPLPANVIRQVKYVPPVVEDSVTIDDSVQLMTADEIPAKVKIGEVPEIVKEIKEELQENEAEHEPFLSVQEMPEPIGGEASLYKYIEGKVFVRFCVTSKGVVDQVRILKGVDPDLDAEAIRVVKTFPPFKPGKQDGKPVPVWFSVSINFQL